MEGDPLRFRHLKNESLVYPSRDERPGEDIQVSKLEGGEWSVDHHALISTIGKPLNPRDRALKVRINFFEGNPESIEIDRKETLRIIKHYDPAKGEV
jgi:hypothetical protein